MAPGESMGTFQCRSLPHPMFTPAQRAGHTGRTYSHWTTGLLGEETTMTDTVLIIDEDANARIIAETLLRTRGLHVLAATDATQACDIICCEEVAVVVLALTVADTRGLEVLRRLRGRFETRMLPTQPRV